MVSGGEGGAFIMHADADNVITAAAQYSGRYDPEPSLTAVAMKGTRTANTAAPSCMYDMKALAGHQNKGNMCDLRRIDL